MNTPREASAGEVDAVIDVHLAAFPGFFLTLAGRGFLRELYAAFLHDRDAALLVCGQPERTVAAFLAGTPRPDRFFAELRRRRGVPMALRLVPALLRHPWRVAERLWAAVRYRGDQPRQLDGYWLLSSLAVHPHTGRRGLGQALVNEFCSRARAASAPGVYLLTDGSDNESAVRFYSRLGFTVEQSLSRSDGREMLVLTRRFASE